MLADLRDAAATGDYSTTPFVLIIDSLADGRDDFGNPVYYLLGAGLDGA